MNKRLILCDCNGSQTIDVKTISSNCDVLCSKIYSELCTSQINNAATEIAKGNAIIACMQERSLFEELAGELDVAMPDFVDLRDRAGWSEEGANSSPKMAALLRDSLLEYPITKTIDVHSEGRCLIIGTADVALPAAAQLAGALSVTALLPDASDMPTQRSFEVAVGKIKQATGTFGSFSLEIDALQQLLPGGRGEFRMGTPKDGGKTQCDLIIDLSGSNALFPAPEKRDGYLFCDPRNPVAIAKTLARATDYVGTFEKPIYLKLEEHLCAHSRAQLPGCSKCLDICPTGAISSNGDNVKIDPMICGGCGSCVALCPSGALTYDSPPTGYLFQRITNLAQTFIKASKLSPRLLVCDSEFGAEMISLAARFDRGLPHDVIPLEIEALSNFGHAEMLASLACGFCRVDILLSPKTGRDLLNSEAELANTIAANQSVTLLDLSDPTQLCEILYAEHQTNEPVEPILPLGSRRQITRLAASALRQNPKAPIPLPAGAPYGAIKINTDRCTLCLSCAALCPTGALADNPDSPQLRFQEDACLQCGLCTNVCPENALSLMAQLDLSDSALAQKTLHEEEPFACIECGTLFGVKSTVEKISKQLANNHSMFSSKDTARLIEMCENCRVEVQYKNTDNPFQGGERPKTITTDDYLKGEFPDADYLGKRKDH